MAAAKDWRIYEPDFDALLSMVCDHKDGVVCLGGVLWGSDGLCCPPAMRGVPVPGADHAAV